MLKNLAEFVELLQEKDRNQLQLTALAVILFMPNNYLSGIGLNEDFFDEWTSFLTQIIDMPCDGYIGVAREISFERSEKQFRVVLKLNTKGKMILHSVVASTKYACQNAYDNLHCKRA